MSKLLDRGGRWSQSEDLRWDRLLLDSCSIFLTRSARRLGRGWEVSYLSRRHRPIEARICSVWAAFSRANESLFRCMFHRVYCFEHCIILNTPACASFPGTKGCLLGQRK
jgi:hypothetical protein